MNYLHPGTVAGPDSDQDFVIIQLDDGDSRDIHVDQVRLLPENYPFVGIFPIAKLFDIVFFILQLHQRTV